MMNASELRGKLALVTGASGGIGSAIANALAAEGATLALAYGSNAEPAETLVAEITTNGAAGSFWGERLRELLEKFLLGLAGACCLGLDREATEPGHWRELGNDSGERDVEAAAVGLVSREVADETLGCLGAGVAAADG